MHTILGINGTTGGELAAILRKQNLPVRGVSRRPFPGDWEHVQADVLNPVELLAATAGSSVVYLLVGLPYEIEIWRRDWPIAMENTINACLANNAKLVFLDNVYALGLVNGPMTEETPHNPCSKKGVVRAQVDDMMLDAMKNKGLRGCIARSADFYGPNSDKSVLNSTLFDRHILGKSAFVFGRPDKVHTYTYTRDLAPALAILGTDDRADGQIWNIPTAQEPWTGADWVKASAAAFGLKPTFQATPTFVLRIMGLFNKLFKEMVEMNYQYTHDYVLSSAKFEKTFGLKPTSFEKGLEETVAYYKARKK
ncbi:MAG: NAD-dependent epimerase/dehydratase family protein [Bacteroidota bacterium]